MSRDDGPPPEAMAATLTSDSAVPAAPRDASGLPDTIGRFQVDAKLGEGGMGVVLLATDTSLGRRVALKLLRAGARTDADGRQRFLREAQVMARLAHENVVVVHEVGEHEGQGFVAMEYVAGGTLKSWQAGRGWREILATYLRAGRGLEAAHAAGLVHRDFKPDNVLIGDAGRVRVTDFGLAGLDAAAATLDAPRDVEAATPAPDLVHTPLTRTGARMGTPRYMAPEQHLGESLDARADQFAFCVALHEALFGRPPFLGDTYAEIAANVTAGERQPAPRETEVPAPVREAITRGLARERDARFGSMKELLAALASGAAPPRSRRRWLLPLGVAAALAALTVIAVVRLGAQAPPSDVRAATVAAGEGARTPPRDAVGPLDGTPPEAEVPGAPDTGLRIEIGHLSGEAMTDGIRARSRPAIAATINRHAPALRAALAPDAAEAPTGSVTWRYYLDASLDRLDTNADGEVTCSVRVTIGVAPEPSGLVSVRGSAKVPGGSNALKVLDAKGAECVETVLDELLAVQVLPFIRKREALRGPAPPPRAPSPS